MLSDEAAASFPESPALVSQPGRWMFAAVILVSAFLLFQVQFITAKYILPWFGGTPAVEILTKPDFHFPTLKALADAAIGPAA